MSGQTPEVEYVTPDARPPFSVRRMKRADGAGVTHIIARDGFTIIATLHHDREGVAESLAAAPDLLFALKRAVSVAAEAARAWDADNDSRVGKLLLALEGSRKGYRADIDGIHEAISKAEQGK